MPPVKELHYFNELSRIKRTDPPRCKDARDRWFLKEITALSERSYIDLESYSRLFEANPGLLHNGGDEVPMPGYDEALRPSQ